MIKRMTNRPDKGKWAPSRDEKLERLGRAMAETARPGAQRRPAEAPPPRIPTPELPARRQPNPRETDPPTSPYIAGAVGWETLGTLRGREFGVITAPILGFENAEFEIDPNDGRPVLDLAPGQHYLWYVGETEPSRVYTDERGEEQIEYVDKYRPLRRWPVGTYAKLTKPKGATKSTGATPVDGLLGLPLLMRGAGPSRRRLAPTRDAILAALERRGVYVAAGANGELLVSAAGRIGEAELQALQRPGMAAYLTASPALRCAWPHDGEAPEAMTLDVLGVPLCSVVAHKAAQPASIVGRIRAAVGLA